MLRRCLALAFLLLSVQSQATEVSPWYTPNLELQPRLTYTGQTFQSVHLKRHLCKYPSYNSFLTGSLQAALINDIGAEVELTYAYTRSKGPHFDNFKLTGRYQLFDDVADEGDLSVIAGASFAVVFKQAQHDIASMHHGGVEGELFASVGKEFDCESLWLSRIWSLFGIGMGDIGDPWLHGRFVIEKNFCNQSFLSVFVDTLIGLGPHSIHNVHHFHGYGPLAHRSLDLGGSFTYRFECGGDLAFAYTFRLYAKNYPYQTNSITLSYVYPFGL